MVSGLVPACARSLEPVGFDYLLWPDLGLVADSMGELCVAPLNMCMHKGIRDIFVCVCVGGYECGCVDVVLSLSLYSWSLPLMQQLARLLMVSRAHLLACRVWTKLVGPHRERNWL